MKYCIKCGSKINFNDGICPNCKYKFQKDKNLLILLLIVLVPLVSFITYFLIKESNTNKAETNLIKNYVINETNNLNVKMKYKKEYNCKECTTSCDGSCFWYGDKSNCTINKYTITNNNLKYTAYYINNNGNISYISDYVDVQIYKNLEEKLKNEFSDYDLEIKYKNHINKEKISKENKLNIELKKHGEIDKIYTKKLHNLLNKYLSQYDYSTNIELKLIYGKNKYLTINYKTSEIYEKYSDGSSVNLSFNFGFTSTYEDFLKEIEELSI